MLNRNMESNEYIAQQYLDILLDKLRELRENAGSIANAAQLLFECVQKGGRIFAFGSGHSHMIAEEIYTRAGGYAPLKAILPPELMLHEMPIKSTYLERLPGYAAQLIALYKLRENDALIIISNSGRNAAPVEMASLAKEAGCKVIGVTSMIHSGAVASRSGEKRLFELCDVVLDNRAEKGDAALRIEGLAPPVGATSTVTGAALVQAVMACFVQKLVEAGQTAPVFYSSNLDGADAENERLFEQYCGA